MKLRAHCEIIIRFNQRIDLYHGFVSCNDWNKKYDFFNNSILIMHPWVIWIASSYFIRITRVPSKSAFIKFIFAIHAIFD